MNQPPGNAAIPFDRRTALLRRIPGFAELPADFIAELAENLREESHPCGATVVSEGEVGDRLYLIASGRAEVFTKGPQSPIALATLLNGDMFGEIALLTPTRRRQATVKAVEPLHTLSLSAADFEKAMQAFPDVRVDLALAADSLLNAKFLKRQSA